MVSPFRRTSDQLPEVLVMRLSSIEEDLKELKEDFKVLNRALVGDTKQPGFVPMVEVHNTILTTHSKNFRFIASVLIAQLLLLLCWALGTIYSYMTQAIHFAPAKPGVFNLLYKLGPMI